MSKLVVIMAVLVVGACLSATVNGLGGEGMVGARTKVINVESNKEIQDLGRYSVEQYNKQKRTEVKSPNGGVLKFKAVVEAETQVVAGIKYYLKIATSTTGGKIKTFDAVVVVRPWEHSKELLNFAPSPSY